jgi:heptosyltransferase I
VQYDAVIDCQGLTKSAIVARCAALTATGKRYALANRTAGSGYEAPTRWVADVAITLPQQVHAVERSRMLCAQALGYTPSDSPWSFGLDSRVICASTTIKNIVFVHASSREDKSWPIDHWVQLAQQLQAQGCQISLVHGSDTEQQRSQEMAQAMGGAVKVWPRVALDELTTSIAHCAGVIGVDSGVSHIAVALNKPHVQLYNFDTAWRTGPVNRPRQTSVFAQPQPSVAQVWAAWLQVSSAAGLG